MNNGEITKRIHKDEVQNYLNNGWVLGRFSLSTEYKEKIRKTLQQKIWIKKDNQNMRITEDQLEEYLDNGWSKGFIINKGD